MIRKNISIILVLIIIAIYVVLQIKMTNDDHEINKPVITFDENTISVSVKSSNEDLLKGVHATDVEDGNLTDKVTIESMSEFIKPNVRKVNYIVFDRDDHVTKASRLIHYKDYKAPVFALTDQLRASRFSLKEVMKILHANSCVDGDISSKISVMNTSMEDHSVLNLKLSVTDSTNTTSYLTTNFYLSQEYDYKINLKEYLVYLHVGDKYDYKSNIQNIMGRVGVDNSLISHVDIDIPTMNKPGVYEVNYTLPSMDGDAITTMVVVVE